MRIRIFLLILLGISVIAQTQSDPKKENVQTKVNFMDSTLTDIIWCGGDIDDEMILVLTENGSVYRSEDKGFTWNKLTDIFMRSGYLELDDKKEKVGTVSRIIRSPKDKKMVIFQGSKGINWLTEDCGKNIKAMNQGRNVNEFMFHPSERNWILAAAWTICEDFEDRPCEIFKELFVSFDLGEKWELIEDYVVQFSWGALDESFYPEVPKERIILAHEPLGKGNQQISGWSEKVHLSYTDDFFKSTKSLSEKGNKFLLTSKYLFVAKVIDEESQDVTLLAGNPKARKYELNEAQMPIKRLKDHSYTILDSTEGQVFLHINHYGSKSKHGNIYISDSTGTRFSLSLLHNVRNLDGQCDFEKVQGIEGVYLANVYDSKKIELIRGADNSAIPGETISKRQRDKTETHYDDLENFRQTMISFDKGGIWKPLIAPLKDSEGKKITCPDDNCSLHLHSITNLRFGPFYSTNNSVGLIMGTGNVGYHLSNRADNVNTYLSRDSGVTWFEVKKGSHIYEIGDHGGLILMAPDQEATNTVYYSWNEGLTWESLKVSEDAFEVTNIIIEPSNTGTSFIVYGESTKGKGVIAAVEFYTLHGRTCQGADKPNEASSDYEIWTPVGLSGSKCLLGKKISYVRRKRDAACFNGEEFERPTFIENCPCTEEDWECDLGYAREKDGPCKLTNPGKENDDYKPPQNCSGYYFVSQGYRKVAGDACVGGVNHEPLRIPCPGISALSNTNLSVLFILVLLIAAIILVGTNNPIIGKTKDFITDFLSKRSSGSSSSQFKEYERPIFSNFDQIPDNSDVDFTKMVFEENEDRAEPIDERSHYDNENPGRRKLAERKALQAAAKPVPALGKPKKNKNGQEGDLIDFDPRK